MFETIVLATDGRSGGSDAVRYAAELASRHGSQLVVVHVADTTTTPDEIRGQVEQLRRAGVPTRLVLIGDGGQPAAAVADFATALKADVVVTGISNDTAGRGCSVVGRIVQRILALSPCPVLAVPGQPG